MRFYYDFEFIEYETRTWPRRRRVRTIEPISIGIVAEDGREYYAVNRDMPQRQIRRHDWIMANVVPHLPKASGDERNYQIGWLFNPFDQRVKPVPRIADEVRDFLLGPDHRDSDELPHVELWAWYGAYDHVSLAWLWGPMSDLPEGIPMFTCDLKQEAERLGNPRMPDQPSGEHNALADARHNAYRHRFLTEYAAQTTDG